MKNFFDILNNIPLFAQAKVVMCYVSTEKETDTHSLIQKLLGAGKKVAVPKTGENFSMDFYFIENFSDLVDGRYGIKEPVASDDTFFNPCEKQETLPAVIVVPGVEFDEKRNRKGHGVGYYDRYFHRYGAENFFKIALTHDSRVREALDNVMPHDVPMDLIITESGRMI